MILDTILKIIPIILSVPACILALKSLKMCNEIKCKIDPKKEEINVDEILYSFEFNTALDGKIRPLLGKYSNDKIVKIIIDQMYGSKIYDKIPIPVLEEHIRETLRNYNNPYNANKDLYEFLDESVDDQAHRLATMNTMVDNLPSNGITVKVDDSLKGTNGVTPNNQTNINNVLNNFYKE